MVIFKIYLLRIHYTFLDEKGSKFGNRRKNRRKPDTVIAIDVYSGVSEKVRRRVRVIFLFAPGGDVSSGIAVVSMQTSLVAAP